MKNKKSFAIKMSVIVVLLVIAGISIGVIIQSKLSDRRSLEQQEQLAGLWNSSSGASQTSTAQNSEQSAADARFAELSAINPDMVGWLEVGELSAPVVQTDNNEFYLTHDFYGKEDPHGTVFVDTRNDVSVGDDNMVLYGHNYNQSKMVFYEVEKYKDATFASQHPVFAFTTETERREYLVLGLFYANTVLSQGEVFDYHNQLTFTSEQEFDSFLEGVRSRSLITTNAEADDHDQLITLSTCGYDFNGQRIVLLGRKLRPNEDADKLAASLQYDKNPAPVMPELWEKLYGKAA